MWYAEQREKKLWISQEIRIRSCQIRRPHLFIWHEQYRAVINTSFKPIQKLTDEQNVTLARALRHSMSLVRKLLIGRSIQEPRLIPPDLQSYWFRVERATPPWSRRHTGHCWNSSKVTMLWSFMPPPFPLCAPACTEDRPWELATHGAELGPSGGLAGDVADTESGGRGSFYKRRRELREPAASCLRNDAHDSGSGGRGAGALSDVPRGLCQGNTPPEANTRFSPQVRFYLPCSDTLTSLGAPLTEWANTASCLC